ncbi:hypothetical protein Tco_1384271 [Tanacetum coccineum]
MVRLLPKLVKKVQKVDESSNLPTKRRKAKMGSISAEEEDLVFRDPSKQGMDEIRDRMMKNLFREERLQEWVEKKSDDIDWKKIVEQVQERQFGSMIRYQTLKKKPVTVAQARKNMMKLRTAQALGSEPFQELSSEEPKELSKEDIRKLLEIVLVEEFRIEALQIKLYGSCLVHHASLTSGHDIYMLPEKDYPLTTEVMSLMLSRRLQVEEDSEMARDLVKKIFI